MTARILDGKTIARLWRGELKQRVDGLVADRVAPSLAVIRVGEDPASRVYVATKQRACAEVGIRAQVIHLPAAAGQNELLAVLDHLAADPAVHGIIVQLPLPAGYDPEEVQERVPPAKDVDGLHPLNQGLLAAGRPRFVPATPRGIVELLVRSEVEIAGRHAVILGRSAIVGRPLAQLLSSRGPAGNATVTLCHTGTRDLPAMLRQGDLLVVAAGRPGLVTGGMVRPGAVVVDVGVNRVDAPDTARGYRLAGDVDHESVRAVAGALTPVPGGVGPMTVAGLVHNTIVAAEMAARPAGAHA